MSEQVKHTPTPWVLDIHGNIMGNGSCVASTWGTNDDNHPNGRPWEENARLIVEAVNCHATLKAQRDAFLSVIERVANEVNSVATLGELARAALTAAKQTTP